MLTWLVLVLPIEANDLTDLDFADKVVAGSDAVIHMAGIPSPRDERQYNVYKNNVNATFAIFSAAANAKCRVVAYASSCSAYGQAWSDEWTSPLYAPVDEAHPFIFEESYALSKEVNERSALMWSRRCGTAFVLILVIKYLTLTAINNGTKLEFNNH